MALRNRGAGSQAGVPVLEDGVLLFAVDDRQLRRDVRDQEHPTRVTPQHAA